MTTYRELTYEEAKMLYELGCGQIERAWIGTHFRTTWGFCNRFLGVEFYPISQIESVKFRIATEVP